MNIKVFVDGEQIDVPQSSTEDSLSDAEKELFDRVITAYYYTDGEDKANELFHYLHETLGPVVEPVEKGWYDDLIERIRKSENVKVVMT